MVVFQNDHIITVQMVVYFMVEVFMLCFFKNIHHSPRPFWLSEEIRPQKCSDEFGNPSGHSLIASHFAMYLFFSFVHKQKSNEDERQDLLMEHAFMQRIQNSGETAAETSSSDVSRLDSSIDKAFADGPKQLTYVQKLAIFLVLNIGWIVMGYSRLILGMHSLNQIIYGALLGLLTCAFCMQVIGPIVA